MSEWPKQLRMSLRPGDTKRGQWIRGIWYPRVVASRHGSDNVTDGSFVYEVYLDGPDNAEGTPSKSELLHSRVYLAEPSQQEIASDVVRRHQEYGY